MFLAHHQLVRQSAVSQSFFFVTFVGTCIYDTVCRYAYLPGSSDSIIFLAILVLLNLEFWRYIEYINEQFVLKRNFFYTAAWNFMKLL